jgi:pimeloyl-ACP methyl ester carboxylesterase
MSARVRGVIEETLVQRRAVRANGLDFEVLEFGAGPLALCLHGFPDSPHTWRHLLPALAAAGFHAVAPFMRGYAPTAIPADGCSVAALVADACGLHDALAGDQRAVIIGNDWGADAAYGAAAYAPERWRRVVTLGQPPAASDARLNSDYDQLRRFFTRHAGRRRGSSRPLRRGFPARAGTLRVREAVARVVARRPWRPARACRSFATPVTSSRSRSRRRSTRRSSRGWRRAERGRLRQAASRNSRTIGLTRSGRVIGAI